MANLSSSRRISSGGGVLKTYEPNLKTPASLSRAYFTVLAIDINFSISYFINLFFFNSSVLFGAILIPAHLLIMTCQLPRTVLQN